MIPAFSEINGEWNAISSTRKDSPRTAAMKSGMRPVM